MPKRIDVARALHIAARQGDTETVRLLVLKGANKDALDVFGRTSLYLATKHDHVATALALIAAGSDIDLRFNDFQASFMHVAAGKGHVEILQAVFERGADVYADDEDQATALHDAAA